MTEPDSDGAGTDEVADEPDVTPLLAPADGVPAVAIYASDIARAAEQLAGGHGAFALDAERASGFRYSNRAYLIQIRRAGAGTVLIDPVSHGIDPLKALAPVAGLFVSPLVSIANNQVLHGPGKLSKIILPIVQTVTQ